MKENSIVNMEALLLYTILQWRKIIVCAITVALIAAAYGGLVITSAQSSITENTEVMEAADKLEKEITILEEQVSDKTKYINTSMLMKLDYENVNETMVRLYVSPEDGQGNLTEEQIQEFNENILNSYILSMLNSDMFEEINTQLKYNMDSQYIREFVTYWTIVENGRLTIRIRTLDLNDNDIIKDIVVEYINIFYSELNQEEEHLIDIIEDSPTIIMDNEIKMFQEEEQLELAYEVENLAVKKQELEAVMQTQQSGGEKIATDIPIKDRIIRASIFGVLGGGIGIFLTVFFIALYQILTNRIQDGRYINEEYKVIIFGQCPQFLQKKNLIDQLILKCFKRTRYKDEDEFYSYIATRINLVNPDRKNICLLGSVSDELLEKTCDEMKKYTNAHIQCARNINESRSGVNSVMNADILVLVEKTFETRDRDVSQLFSVVKELGKEIKGVIIL